MIRKPLSNMIRTASEEKRRVVAPLMGFPGLNLTNCSVKLAQQNYREHFRVLNALVETFQPDMIFPLMDLAVIANALGRYTLFPEDESATVVKAPFPMDELERIKEINISFDTRLLGYVETLKLMNIGLPGNVLKGAYVSGPYSLAALLMGADQAAMATMIEPDKLDDLCRFTTNKIQEYIRMLIAGGAELICILEPSAVMLGPDQFQRFSGRYVHHINESFCYSDISTIYHTCGNTMHLVELMAESGVSAISLDSPAAGVDLPRVAEKLPSDVIVMGNINPTGAILKGKPEDVEAEVTKLLESMKPYPNFILSTGCDLPQETPIENIHAFMKAARRYRTGG